MHILGHHLFEDVCSSSVIALLLTHINGIYSEYICTPIQFGEFISLYICVIADIYPFLAIIFFIFIPFFDVYPFKAMIFFIFIPFFDIYPF